MRRVLLLCLLAVFLAPTAARAATPPKPRWVAFGDSYAAGEGLEHPSRDDRAPYGTNSKVVGSGRTIHECQRALADDKYPSAAWGATLANGRSGPFAFVPCTGAITDDLLPSPQARIQAGQLEQGRFFSGANQFDVVTLSFGGNNIGFPDVVAACAGISLTGAATVVAAGAAGWLNAPWVGCTESELEMKSRIDRLTDTSSVDDEPSCNNLGDNTSSDGHWDDDHLSVGRITIPELYDVIGRCVAPGGTVVVMGYPQILEETSRWSQLEGNRCHRIRRADVGKLRGAAAHLDERIRQAVDWANGHTPAKFVFVDPNHFWEGGSENLTPPSEANRSARQNRHALCGSGEDWLNGVTIGTEGDGAARKNRSFHPNQRGHDAMARTAAHVDFHRKTLSKGDLRNAPVPSVCGHPAGTLVDGKLPDVPEIEGGTWLDTDPSLIADIDGDGIEEGFAFIGCSYGGVGTPDTLGVWGPGPRLLDFQSLYDLAHHGSNLGDYESDRSGGVRLAADGAGRLKTVWLANRDGDFACCPTYPMDVSFKFAKGKLIFDRFVANDERSTVKAIIEALNAGDVAKLRTIPTKTTDVSAELEDAAKNGARPFGASFVCAGGTDSVSGNPVKRQIYDHGPPPNSPGSEKDFGRGCTFTDAEGGANYIYLDWDSDEQFTRRSWVIRSVYLGSLYGD